MVRFFFTSKEPVKKNTHPFQRAAKPIRNIYHLNHFNYLIPESPTLCIHIKYFVRSKRIQPPPFVFCICKDFSLLQWILFRPFSILTLIKWSSMSQVKLTTSKHCVWGMCVCVAYNVLKPFVFIYSLMLLC